jgi:hypothetical protein
MAKTNATDVARQLSATYGTTKDAAEELIRMAEQDHVLHAELTSTALRDAAFTLIRRINSNDRNRVWQEAKDAPLAQPPVTIESWGQAVGQSLLDHYHVKNGKRLGDATRDEVAETVQHLEDRASNMLDKSAWLRLVLAGLKGTEKVRQQFTEDKLHALQAQALAGRRAA